MVKRAAGGREIGSSSLLALTITCNETIVMISDRQLEQAFIESWNEDTCVDSSVWSPDNPSRGQCVPTALIVQDVFGGELEKLRVSYDGVEESHYRNILPDGSVRDYTRKQYPTLQVFRPTTVVLHKFHTIREKRLSDDDTRKRYELLKKRVDAFLLAHTV